MNLKILRLKTMVALTAAWVGEQRAMFLSVPQIAGLLPDVERVHAQVLKQQAVTEADEQVAALTEALAEVDQDHDRMIRAIWYAFEASIEYLRGVEPAREAEAAELEAARNRLLPSGLGYIQRSYLEEAGIAASIPLQLTPELRAVLEQVPLRGGNGLDAVMRWAALGAHIGDLERRRTLLLTAQSQQDSAFDARLSWARVARTVIGNLDLATDRPEVVTALRQPFLDALAEATAKAARARKESAATAAAAAAGEAGAAESGAAESGAAAGASPAE